MQDIKTSHQNKDKCSDKGTTKFMNASLVSFLTGRSRGEGCENFQHVRLPNAHERWTCRQQLHPAGSAGGSSHCTHVQLFFQCEPCEDVDI